ncbi:DinB family protein [Granulicella aggregans]|uniref:DinB family protein n=1 Tax=Granulicella aggregans TaxID=474949 RepID=UPI0021DFD089|nr:DinB family protein [Granulicella aggregans]
MIGRPETHEASEFHWNYINEVEGDDPLAALLNQLPQFDELLGDLSEEKSLHRYATGKWSIREAMSHITDTERIFAGRALWFARGLGDPLPGFDQDVAVAGAEADRVRLADHLEEFRQVRLSTLTLYRHLPPTAWMRTGTANGKTFTVRAMAFLLAGHAEHHLTLFREKYLV